MFPSPVDTTVTAIDCVAPVPGAADPSCLNIDNVSATNDAVAAVNDDIFDSFVVILVEKEDDVAPNAPDISVAICADEDINPDVCPDPASSEVTLAEKDDDASLNDPEMPAAVKEDPPDPPPPNPDEAADDDTAVSKFSPLTII